MEIKKVEVTTFIEKYVAVDGTEFNSKDQCIKYEESAFGVMMARLHKFALKDSTEYEVFAGAGCEDNGVVVVAPKTDDEVKTIQQVLCMEVQAGDKWKEKYIEMVEVGKVLALVFSSSNDAWVVDLGEMIREATAGKYKLTEAK